MLVYFQFAVLKNSFTVFPKDLRKEPGSLKELAKDRIVNLTHDLVNDCTNDFEYNKRDRDAARRYDQERLQSFATYLEAILPGHLQDDLLTTLVTMEDPWKFSCSAVVGANVKCKEHKECKILYRHADKLLKLLISRTTGSIRFNLKRIDPSLHLKCLNVVLNAMKSYEELPNLKVITCVLIVLFWIVGY